jgi:hypothetical protein
MALRRDGESQHSPAQCSARRAGGSAQCRDAARNRGTIGDGGRHRTRTQRRGGSGATRSDWHRCGAHGGGSGAGSWQDTMVNEEAPLRRRKQLADGEWRWQRGRKVDGVTSRARELRLTGAVLEEVVGALDSTGGKLLTVGSSSWRKRRKRQQRRCSRVLLGTA